MNKPIRVLLVGGNEAVRQELSHTLGSEEEIAVIGQAGSDEEALVKVKKLSPALIIVLTDDNMMPDMNGIDTARAITEAQLPAKVIIMTESPLQYLVPAIKTGAVGILPKNISHNELLPAIRSRHLWSPGLARVLLGR